MAIPSENSHQARNHSRHCESAKTEAFREALLRIKRNSRPRVKPCARKRELFMASRTRADATGENHFSLDPMESGEAPANPANLEHKRLARL